MIRKPIDQLCLTSRSPDQTRRLGETIGRHLNGRTAIALSGNLGSGKTVFVQGIARGLSVPTEYPVTSPTYTFINEYPGRLRLIHADLYRISAAEELIDIGFDDMFNENNVVAIEWADRIGSEEISFDIDVRIRIIDDTTREFHFFFYGRNHANLINRLKNYSDPEKKGKSQES